MPEFDLSPPGNHASVQDLLASSETAYQAGDFGDAVRAMRQAVALHPGDAALAHRLAHCLEQAGQPGEAETLYRRALELDPAMAGGRQSLVHLCLARRDFDGAIREIEEQRRICGDAPGLDAQLRAVLDMAGRFHDALLVVQRQNDAPGGSEADLLHEAELASHLGHPQQALKAAHAAWLRFPGSVPAGMLLARLLCAEGRFKHAIDVLARVRALDPGNVDATQMLATAYGETGAFKPALQLLLALIAQNPDSALLWHRTAILANLAGFHEQAAELLKKAAELDPGNPDLPLLRGHILGALHRYGEAVEVLDEAERLAPGTAAVRDLKIAYLHQMGGGPEFGDDGGGLILPLPRLSARQRDNHRLMQQPGWRGFALVARLQARVLAGLVLREISHRTAMSKFGMASAILEPLAQIVMLGVVLAIFNQGRPPLGTELFFFYATGVLPFYLFIHVVDHNLNIFADNQNLLQVPLINRLDLVFAVAIAELITGAATTFLVFTGFYLLGHGERTDNVIAAAGGYLAVWLLALGIGLVLAVLNNQSRMVQRVWTSVQRALYFLSGIFFLAQQMPDWVRAILVWNPLLLCIEWFRTGFFPQYAPPWLDKLYVVAIAGALIVTGLMLERALRRRLKTA